MTVKLGVFLSTQSDPMSDEKQAGIFSIASQSDCFCWGESKTNLIAHFNTFSRNSWGEFLCKSYQGADSWLQCFLDSRDIFSDIDDKLYLYSEQLPQRESIEQRLLSLVVIWNELSAEARKINTVYRFVMAVGKQYLLIHFSPDGVESTTYPSLAELFDALLEPAAYPVVLKFDGQLPLPDYLDPVFNRDTSQANECFFVQVESKLFEVYIRLSNGLVYRQQYEGAELIHLPYYYQQFIDTLRLSGGMGMPWDIHQEVRFWTVAKQKAEKKYSLAAIQPNTEQLPSSFWQVKALACFDSEKRICFDLSLDEHTFKYRDYGELVFRQLAQLILSKRQGANLYPVFITHLDLSAVILQPSLESHFYYKKLLENQLALALKKRMSIVR